MAGLSLEDVDKYYGERAALSDINLTIADGEFIALVGPSGCGKTTLLRLIAGFERADRGCIYADDVLLSDARSGVFVPPEARQMGMVFQAYALWPHMNVCDNIAYPLKIRGLSRAQRHERVAEVLAQTGLSDYATRYPKALSGGQQQRVALARCLVADAQVILLDEPLANLDKHLRSSMEETFRQIHRESGVTFVYVTHDQQEAMALADRIAVLKDGVLQQCDPPQQLYREPRNRWVAQFIGEGRVVRIAASTPLCMLEATQHGAITLAKDAQASLPAHIRPRDVTLSDEGIAAQVVACIYRGERYVLELTLASGESLVAYADCAHQRGREVHCQIERAWTLPETDD